MARKPEQRLWDRMRDRAAGSGVWLQRVENLAGEGRPDVDAMCSGTFTVVELKAVDAFPVRASTTVLGPYKGLSQKQLNWWLRWNAEGGRGLIVVGVGSEEVYAFDGGDSEQLNRFTAEQFQRRALLRSWPEIFTFLRGY